MRYLGLILLCAYAASAQAADGITTTVSRTVNIASDEADFVVSVYTTLDIGQDKVAQPFHDAGIQNLTVALFGAYQAYPAYTASGPGGPVIGQLSYQITFTAAPAALVGYTKKLDSINANLPDGFEALQYDAALNASQAAVDAAHQTVLPLLLQDARTKAQAIASAAGLTLGAITGMNDGATGFIYQSVSGLLSSLTSSATRSGTQYTFYATVKSAAQ